MTLTLAITINALFDGALLGLLAVVMSRPSKLESHLALERPARAPVASRARQSARIRAGMPARVATTLN